MDPLFGLHPTHLLAISAVVFVAFAILLRLRKSPSRPANDGARLKSNENLLAENQELRKTIGKLQVENRQISNFFLLLPDFTKQLNRHLEKRNIAPLLSQLLDYLFSPKQVMIFFRSQRSEEYLLVAKKGVGPDVELHTTIAPGKGKIGWVAQHQITMSGTDFAHETQIPQGRLTPLDRYQQGVELCAPMVHDNRTLGVIALGGLKRHPKNEKPILKMVADLGSIALNNAALFKKIQSDADCDGLTQLTNKRHFLVRLGEAIFRAEKSHSPLSVFIFDIDHFKNYNDANGHLAGDEALKITSRLLKENTREDDVTARYGGEEFIVIFINTTKEGAHRAAEKIRMAMENFPFPNGKSQPNGRVTISGGVSTYPRDGSTSTELISAADQALYEAKNTGRNRTCVHETKYLSEEDDSFYLQRQEL